jgi:hypothetical protein
LSRVLSKLKLIEIEIRIIREKEKGEDLKQGRLEVLNPRESGIAHTYTIIYIIYI